MGYRSDLAIKMSRSSYDAMMECVKKLEQGELDEFTKTLDFTCTTPQTLAEDIMSLLHSEDGTGIANIDDEYVVLHFEYLKWYSEYNDVRFIEHFMRLDGDYDFLRIGEDMEDIEQEFNTDTYPFYVSRSICFDM